MTAELVLLGMFYSVAVGAIVFALGWGGRAERSAAFILLGMKLVQDCTRPFVPMVYQHVDPVPFVVDTVGFLGFAWIGLRARRYWPLFAAAFQLVSLSGHFARAIEVSIHPMVYALMKTGPTFLVFVVLIAGTASYRRRLAKAHAQQWHPASSGPAGRASWRRRSPG